MGNGKSQSGLQADYISPEEGGRSGGKWSFGVNAHRALSIRLRKLRVYSGCHEELGEVPISVGDDEL